MKKYLLFFLLLGCSTSESVKTRNLYIHTQWIRNTLSTDYLGPTITHTMSPYISEDILYQGNGTDGFVAYNKQKGTEIFRKSLKNGVSSGAAVLDNYVYFGASDGQFYALNKRTGDMVWSFPTQSEVLSAPSVSDKNVYFLSSTGILYALAADTGKVLWNYNRREKTTLSIRSSTSPIVDGNLIYAGFSDGYLVAVSKADGNLKWEKQISRDARFRDIDSTPVIDGNNLFVSSYDGNLFSLDKTTGKTNWTFEHGGFAPVTIQDKKLFFSSSSGYVFCLDKDTGKQIWSYQTDKGSPTQPVFYKELVLFGESRGALVVLQAQDGKFVKSFTTGAGISARPTWDSQGDRFFIMSNHGQLYSLNLEWKRPQQLWPWENKE